MRAPFLSCGKFKINLLMIPVVLALFLLGMGDVILCYIPALLIHEWAHIITASALGMTITQMELFPFGCAARLQCFAVSRTKEMIVAAAGPASNMAAASAVYFINKYGFPISIADKLLSANLALAAVNMLPALPLDGGRIARSLFASFLGYKRATRLTSAAGIFFSALVFALGIIAAVKGSFNPTLFVMAFFLGVAALKELKNAPFVLIRDFSNKRTVIEKRKSLHINRFAAMHSQTLCEIIKEFDAGKYNIVTILDQKLGVVHDLTEQQILDGIMQYGANITIERLYQKERC